MIRGVRAGNPLNEAQNVAEATATAVMARIAAYTGKMVRWTDLRCSSAESSTWVQSSKHIITSDP